MLDEWSAAGPDLAAVDEIVTITMRGPCVVLRPTCELDTMRTRVFVDALNAAVLAGSIVMHTVREPVVDDVAADAVELAGDHAPDDVAVVRAGVIRVPVADVLWTVDVTAGRFVRSDTEIDVRFLVEADWTPYRAMWFAPRTITAATTSDSYVLGHRPSRADALRERATA